MDIGDYVRLTGFICYEERNLLYQNCQLFLIPSVFEGAGIYLVGTLMFGRQHLLRRNLFKGSYLIISIYVKKSLRIKSGQARWT